MLKKLFRAYLPDSKALTLIIIGSISWSLTMVKSGLLYPFGIGFWGPNGHDGIWHIAIAQGLSRGSWEMPIFAGELIKNYHIGFDLLLASLHKLTHIPLLNLYFQVLPILFSLLIGTLTYWFILTWQKSKPVAFWSIFFVYFGGSFGWVITSYKTGMLGGESLFWAQQSISTLVNPPFALSLILIFLGLIFFIKGIELNDKKYLTAATFCFGTLIQIKVYASILILGGLFVSGIFDLLAKRKSEVIKVFVGSLILSILLFTTESKNLILIKPFWFLESLFASPDRFYWPKFAEALLNYRLGNVWVKGGFAFFIAYLIFVIGNFGTRIISVFWLFKRGIKLTSYSYTDILIVSMIMAGVLVPIFFVQSGNPWNTIQFSYYSLIFSGIFAGVWMGNFVERFKQNLMLISVISGFVTILTLPTTFGTLWYNYLPQRPPSFISIGELEALNFLKIQPDGIVLTHTFDKKAADAAINNPPRSLYLYESTAYVSAFSGKKTYLEDTVNLEITDYGWERRAFEVERFFRDPTYDGKFELLEQSGIKYVYVVNELQDKYKDLYLTPNKIFENSNVTIYKLD